MLKGLSIGYDNVKSKVVDGVRRLSELKLWEISLVTFPMNPAAQVMGVKTVDDFAQDLQDFRTLVAECRRSFGK